MKGLITQLTTGLAVAALIALPAAAAAQTPPSQTPATQAPATSGSQSAAQPTRDQASTDAAREHLAKAKAALTDVNTSTLSARVKSQVTELNRRMNGLEQAVASNDNASATGEAARSTRATSGARGNTDWGTELAAIDKTLTMLLGPESANTTGTPSAVGTSGSAASVVVDETTRAKLMEVRSHLTAFATAMAGGDPKTPTPSTDPTTDPNAAAGAPTGTSGTSQTPPATGMSGTQTSGTMQPPPAPSPQTAQPDEQAARRHLTEARNTLSAVTQLPAAAQLTGETRTQVSQLISNFNELITSQNNWRDAYAKVSANLNALIGSESSVTDPTAGAVGTAGDASLDPEIRTRLVELRRQLNEFEKAASGGTAAAGASAAANPPTADPTAPAPPAPPAPPAGTTPPATTPPATTPPGTTPPASTAPAGAQATAGMAGAQPAGNAEAMRQIAAIEALLKSEDDSGGITLTKAQLEQLRTHLASLRQAISR